MKEYKLVDIKRIEFFDVRGVGCMELVTDSLSVTEMMEGGIGKYRLSFKKGGVKFNRVALIFRITRDAREGRIELTTEIKAYTELWRIKAND